MQQLFFPFGVQFPNVNEMWDTEIELMYISKATEGMIRGNNWLKLFINNNIVQFLPLDLRLSQ